MTHAQARKASSVSEFLGSLNILSSVVHELLMSRLRAAIDERLTVAQYKLLKLVARTDAERICDVADFLRVSNAAASRSVERLVRRGLIRRAQVSGDRRASALHMTTRGRELLQRYEATHESVLTQLFPDMSPRDFIRASRLMDRMSAEVLASGTISDEVCFRCGIYFRDRCLLRELTHRACYYEQRKKRQDVPGTGPTSGKGGSTHDQSNRSNRS